MKKRTFLMFAFLIAFVGMDAQWTPVGSLWFSDVDRTFPRIANYNNKPLVSFGSATDSLIDAYIYENGAWQQFGQANFAKGHSFYSRMHVYNDSVYFSYRDISLAPRVSKFSNGNWDSLGIAGATNGNGIYPIIYKDTLFVSLQDFGLGGRLNVAKFAEPNNWIYNPSVPVSSNSTAQNTYCSKWGDSLFVMVNELTSLNLYKYFNGSWSLSSTIATTPSQTPQMSLKVNPLNNSLYAFYQFGSPNTTWNVKKLNGNVWQNVGTQLIIPFGTNTPPNVEMEFVNGVPVVIYQNNNVVSCKKFNGLNAWVDYGTASLVPDLCDNTSLTLIGDTIFAIMRRTSDRKISVLKWPLVNNPATFSAPSALNFCAGTVGIQIPIVVHDEDASSLTNLTATSSNTTLLSNANIQITGNDSIRTLTISLNPFISGSSIITFSVTDNAGNISQTQIQVNVNPVVTPQICAVTVDDASTHNILQWDKTSFVGIDSVRIYREDVTNVYTHIGTVDNDSLSEYHDYGTDPNVTTKRYKISAVDSCGQESALSNYHNTIYIIYAGSGQYIWNPLYTIENTTNPVNNYLLMRDDLSNGTWTQIASTAGTQQTIVDPAYASYPNASWRVETAWSINCSPTRGPINTSRSNIRTNSIGISEISFANDFMSVYPNPANGIVNITLAAGLNNGTIQLFDVLGKQIYSTQVASLSSNIDLSGVAAGIYTIKVSEGNKRLIKKLIVE